MRHFTWFPVYAPDDGTGAGTGTGDGAGKPPPGGTGTVLPGGSGGNGADFENGPWKGLLKDADNLKAVQEKKWQSPEDAVKSYRELETSSSKALKLPGKDAKPEELDAFYNQLGRPEKLEGYEFKIADDVPENFPYEEASATEFKSVAHKARLTSEQAQVLHDWYVKTSAGQFTKSVTADAGKIEAAHNSIIKEWGDPKGEQYKRNIDLANRAMRELSGNDKQALRTELVSIGAMLPDGKVMAPRLVMALAKVGQSLYSEDKIFSDVAARQNPWKTESQNLTEQGRILQQDPEVARQMILAANLKPESFGLKAPTGG